VASPAYELILEVQRIDLALIQVRHHHANHPLRAELAVAAGEVATAEAVLAEIDERRHELERRFKRLSDEVATIEAKRSDVNGKLYGGTITASKDLVALQEEATQLLDRQRGMEDDELEIMEQQEEVDAELGAARSGQAAAAEAEQQAQAALAGAIAELEAEIGELQAERALAVDPVPPELLGHYEQLAPSFDGQPMARLANGRCDGCHIQLSAVAVDQLARAPDDAVVTCEGCGRLLVR
jgi:hypothetical protein